MVGQDFKIHLISFYLIVIISLRLQNSISKAHDASCGCLEEIFSSQLRGTP
jgi:hypothetical protein